MFHYILCSSKGFDCKITTFFRHASLSITSEFLEFPINDGEELKRRYDAIGMRMQYCRYYAKGGVRFTPAGGQTREAHGDMIYEYAYMGMPDPAAHV